MVAELLSDEFLEKLTGYKMPHKQIEWLKHEGFTFRVGADGRAKMDINHYCEIMNGGVRARQQRIKPNLEAVRTTNENNEAAHG